MKDRPKEVFSLGRSDALLGIREVTTRNAAVLNAYLVELSFYCHGVLPIGNIHGYARPLGVFLETESGDELPLDFLDITGHPIALSLRCELGNDVR
jgi:hypothetical protein